MMVIERKRWSRLCEALALNPEESEYTRLINAYSESHRAYHTLQHLGECLQQLDWSASEIPPIDKALAEVALWYHDAVYQPRATDNESKSAEWARRFLTQSGLEPERCQQVYSLIMATCHGDSPTAPLARLVVDIDLSILGSDEARFAEYEYQVRQEYRRIPWFLYKKKRKEILNHFLRRPRLYQTELFNTTYEQKARRNLQHSIAGLS